MQPHLDGAIKGTAEELVRAIPKGQSTHCIFVPWKALQRMLTYRHRATIMNGTVLPLGIEMVASPHDGVMLRKLATERAMEMI